MPSDNEKAEADGANGDPFAEEAPSEAVRYVIEGWGLSGDRDLVVRGRVVEFGASWSLKRGAYNSDAITGTMRIEPDNLTCHVVVRKPEAEILAAGDDVGIVGAVYRRFAHELGLRTQQIMVEHMRAVYPEPSQEGTRVSAGERREPTSETVEF